MIIEKEKILAGRKAVDAYHVAHNLLHSKPWHKGVPEEHTPIVNNMMAELKKQGLSSLQELQAAEKALAVQERNEEIRTLALPAGNPIRFVDTSSLELEESWDRTRGAKELRLDGAISDTVYFRYSHLPAPVMTYADTPEGEKLAQRVTLLGVKARRSQHAHCGRAGRFIWQNDFTLQILTRGRFATLAEAKKTTCALCVQMLAALGVQDVVVTRNNFKVGDRKVATYVGWASYRTPDGIIDYASDKPGLASDVFSTEMIVTLDFDYNLAEQIFPGTREKVITLKEVLGHDVEPQTIKDAALASARAVFNSPVIAGNLEQAELDIIARGRL